MVTESDCRRLPKVELHAHLNGSISFSTISKLYSMLAAKGHNLFNEGIPQTDSLKLQKPTTMEEVFKVFPVIQSLTTTTEAVAMATKDVIKEFNDDEVIYLELRSTPRACPGMSKEQYVEAIIDESGLIVGVELSGDPSIDGRKFLPTLQQARESGLKITVHLAEMPIQLEEVNDFLTFRPDRIGHGTFLHTHEPFVDSVIQQRIPLEICLTSNVMSMTTPSIENSHLRFWMEKSLPFCLCTDDKGMMDCELSGELWKASNAFDLTIDDLWKLSVDALEMSFLEKSSKEYRLLKDLLESRRLLLEKS
ncbi:hypothetical protein KIN20_000855 [Parelaphostrongylus tenuis]|uniref:Adenosine deaminase domain-containing protein n=1 Tax=Parelaphostrongylus tenuis TaxID=148309 RepID=A0AAD5MBU7_PARTN|nr:hypothetical protein KIN20_000855 [Parelaphostrongylus tenuis]